MSVESHSLNCMSTGISQRTGKIGKRELQRHCEEVYIDQEEAKEAQESRIDYFKKKGNLQLTEEGRMQRSRST